MHSFSLASAVVFASAFLARAATPDPLAIATVKQQFINAKIVPDAIPAFSPVSLINATFSSAAGTITVGQVVAKADCAAEPKIVVTGPADATAKYTIMMVDANYVGSTNPNGLNLHWLQNNVAIGADASANGTSAPTIPYTGPGPAAGSGPHRYTILFYQQPANFTAPTTPKANSGVNPINVASYISAAGLTGPLAGTYFTVEVGTATVSVGSTAAVDPKTLSVGSSTGSVGSSSTGSGTSGAPSPTGSGAAVKLGASAIGGSLFGLISAIAILA